MSLQHWPPPPAGNNLDVFNALVPRARTNTPAQTLSQAHLSGADTVHWVLILAYGSIVYYAYCLHTLAATVG